MNFVYFKNQKLLCIFSVFYILLFSIICYFLFLQSTVIHYQIARKNKMVQLLLLKQKEDLAKSDVQTKKELNAWQQKDPHFYAEIQSGETINQLLQLLTHTAQQEGFAIIQAEPITTINNTHHQKSTLANQLQLQLSGTYQNLFYLINQLNNTAWPITLIELKIPQAGQISCVFSSGSGKL